MCEEFIHNRLKDFGYMKRHIKKCLDDVAKNLNMTIEEVCEILTSELKNIELSCINRYSDSKPLKSYQARVVEFMMTHRGVVAAFDVGMGKTLTAIATAECLRKQAEFFGKKLKILVVTPLSLQENFKKEMREVGVKYNKHYEFYPLQTFVNRVKSKDLSCKNKLLIIDEAHELRTDYRGQFEYKMTKKDHEYNAEVAVKCAAKAWKVLLLTATPIYNRPHDIVNLVAMVEGKAEPMTKKEYSAAVDNFENVFGCVFAFKKVEEKEDYPKRIDKVHWIPMGANYIKKYEQLEKNYWKKYAKKITDMEKKSKGDEDIESKMQNLFMTELRQATINLRRNDKDIKEGESDFFKNPKIDIALQIVDSGKKTLIYSEFISSGIDIIRQKLTDKGIKFVEIIGDVPAEDRARAVRRFNRGKVNVLLISKAGKLGLDLVGVRNIVLLEKGWTKAGEDQVIGRGIRYKSHAKLPEKDRVVTVHHLILIKPTDKAFKIDKPPRGYKESADLYLYKYSIKKDKENQFMYENLEKVDIFHKNC